MYTNTSTVLPLYEAQYYNTSFIANFIIPFYLDRRSQTYSLRPFTFSIANLSATYHDRRLGYTITQDHAPKVDDSAVAKATED